MIVASRIFGASIGRRSSLSGMNGGSGARVTRIVTALRPETSLPISIGVTIGVRAIT